MENDDDMIVINGITIKQLKEEEIIDETMENIIMEIFGVNDPNFVITKNDFVKIDEYFENKKEELKKITNNKNYHIIHQGNATNELARTKFNDLSNIGILGDFKYNSKDIEIFIENYRELEKGVRLTAKMLLDAIVIKATEENQNGNKITLPLDEYMNMRGLKDKKSAREQVKEDLDALYKISMNFKSTYGKGKNKKTDYFDSRICTQKGIIKGDIVFTFEQDFLKIIKTYPVMAYPKEILSFNTQYNPNSYNLARKITEHRNMNRIKQNKNIISVKTLLRACTEIPSYEDIKNIGGIHQRIISRFERDLDAIKFLSWHYCLKNEESIPNETIENMTYSEFEELNVKITWNEEIEIKKIDK